MIHVGPFEDWSVLIDSELADREIELPDDKHWSDDTGLQIGLSRTGPTRCTIRFWDLAIAHIFVEQKRIEIFRLSASASAETLDHFLVDQIFPRILSVTGHLVLHAGAIAHEGNVLAFLGPSGFGKSTLVASLHQHGAMLLSDDVLVLSSVGDQFYGRALYPGLRLLPDSIASIFQAEPNLTPFAHYSPKQRVALPVSTSLSGEEQPLAALFFLGPEALVDKISLREMTPAEACIGIVSNSFSLDPTNPDHANEKLKQAGAMASSMPAFELSYPRDFARLPDVRAAICHQLAQLGLST